MAVTRSQAAATPRVAEPEPRSTREAVSAPRLRRSARTADRMFAPWGGREEGCARAFRRLLHWLDWQTKFQPTGT